MLKLIPLSAIILALAIAWVGTAAPNVQVRTPQKASVAPPETIVVLHRQLHRYLAWAIQQNLHESMAGDVD
jgi:hypothetical protein